MSLNDVPSADRVHIGIFGKRNAGKSSVINAVTGQNLAIVSDIRGTTTDPVSKSMELLPLGPVVMIDTPGIDDDGKLGKLRVKKSYQVLNKTDIAVLIVDGTEGWSNSEQKMSEAFRGKKIPYVIAVNKCDDMTDNQIRNIQKQLAGEKNLIFISARQRKNINELKELIARQCPKEEKKQIVGDLLNPGDFVVLVVPIDSAAPKGRLILPQQQTIRDILDANAISVVTKEDRVRETLEGLRTRPRLVITDSQAFGRVSEDVPDDIELTSFSILMARYKGNLKTLTMGVTALESLKDQDTVLISEGCTHHRQCGDIGTEKLPNWIQNYTGRNLKFEFTSGTEFPEDLSRYALVVHCGGCMLNEREVKYRIQCACDQNVPITNYGICIAYIHGILKRTVRPFDDIASELEKKKL